MSGKNPNPVGWKLRLFREFKEYWINFFYLAVFFGVLAWYRRALLAAKGFPIEDYGTALFEAAVLAKVIMVLDLFKLGRRLDHKPLIVSVFYRTAVFGFYVALLGILEATVRSLINGRGWMGGLADRAGENGFALLAQCLVKALALIPFIALKQFERVLGADRLKKILWGNPSTPNKEDPGSLPPPRTDHPEKPSTKD